MGTMKYYTAFLILITTITISSCQTSQYAVLSSEVSTLERCVEDLQQKYATLSSRMTEQDAKIQRLNLKIETISQNKFGQVVDGEKFSDSVQKDRIVKKAAYTNSKKGSKQNNKSKSTVVKGTHSVRCQAITKKGTQCKRTASPGSKYCWQHGG